MTMIPRRWRTLQCQPKKTWLLLNMARLPVFRNQLTDNSWNTSRESNVRLKLRARKMELSQGFARNLSTAQSRNLTCKRRLLRPLLHLHQGKWQAGRASNFHVDKQPRRLLAYSANDSRRSIYLRSTNTYIHTLNIRKLLLHGKGRVNTNVRQLVTVCSRGNTLPVDTARPACTLYSWY